MKSQDADVHLVVVSGNTACSEALKILTEYRDPSTTTTGSGHYATVDGWECLHSSAQAITESGVLEDCTKDGSEFRTVTSGGLPGAVATASAPTLPLETTGEAAGPIALVRTYISYLVKNELTQTCALYDSGTRENCEDGHADGNIPKVTGSMRVAGAIVQGDKALVALVGKICLHYPDSGDERCLSSGDPNTGMPSTAASFQDAFDSAGDGDTGSPFTVERIDGEWRIP